MKIALKYWIVILFYTSQTVLSQAQNNDSLIKLYKKRSHLFGNTTFIPLQHGLFGPLQGTDAVWYKIGEHDSYRRIGFLGTNIKPFLTRNPQGNDFFQKYRRSKKLEYIFGILGVSSAFMYGYFGITNVVDTPNSNNPGRDVFLNPKNTLPLALLYGISLGMTIKFTRDGLKFLTLAEKHQ